MGVRHEPELDLSLYWDALPREVAHMSKTGIAIGYDPLRWGEKAHHKGADYDLPIAVASQLGVQFRILSESERKFITCDENGGTYARRKRYVMARNWYAWGDLNWINHNFIMSLLWLPETGLSPLEMLARAADD